ncbi:hypothetical protein BS78_K290700 [Paspalum vaginatum]|uniref:CCT domain-containing protein n=1 Tax=Paspalum vaginatum TaxID=158149 RepID=A0A9W7XE14_9POAL|nr:hypothetical protein BS78_K290700 [Paspalum vaginatum]
MDMDATFDPHVDPHPMVPDTVLPMATNQLTLSFQGEVQAMLLMLGGRELSSLGNPTSSFAPYKAKLMRFRGKRKERNFDKIRYTATKEDALRDKECSEL